MKNTKVKMGKTFNEWPEEACKTESALVVENGWNTRQSEIDELLLVGNNLLDRIQELCHERDELQKRIDLAIKLLSQDKVIWVDTVAETLGVLKND